jgi:ribosomal protein L11 methyltransferase
MSGCVPFFKIDITRLTIDQSLFPGDASFVMEEEGKTYLFFLESAKDQLPKELKSLPVEETELTSAIDWDQESKEHSPYYRDGRILLPLRDFSAEGDLTFDEVVLEPGPGFGDLSHPTTQLMLSEMKRLVAGKHVIDIGCGNGVLSLAAIGFGALDAIGIDIDKGALEQARNHAELNQCKNKVCFCLPEEVACDPDLPYVFLMNMIRSEQKVAWKSLAKLHRSFTEGLVSGVLATELDAFKKECQERHWSIINIAEKEGWLAITIGCDFFL